RSPAVRSSNRRRGSVLNAPFQYPIATVAMVTFNSERFVREAIESVLAQEFRSFELVVSDDCSTDSTWKIVQEYAGPQVRVFRNEANLGEVPNRNKALELARGKYLMFLDGDDYLYPHGLGHMVKMMEQFPRAAFASALQPCEKFIYPIELTPYQFAHCLFLGPIVIANDFTQLMFRTESLRAAGGFDAGRICGDTYVQIAMGTRENCVLVNGNMAWWPRHPGQASERLLAERWGVIELAKYSSEALEDANCPLSPSDKRVARANIARMVMRSFAYFLTRGHVIH